MLFTNQEKCSSETTHDQITTNPSHVKQTHIEAVAVKNLLHPAVDSQFKAIETTGDNNCLWNAICLCLGLPEYKQIEFRNKTLSTILEHEEHFKTLLAVHPYETIHTVKDACSKSNRSDGWGNEYHLLALALALNRNIYVYSSFKNSTTGRFFQNARINVSKLANMFANKVAQTSQHRNYQPAQGINLRSPICLFFDQPHYTALVPRVSNPIYCVPHEVILQSIELEVQNVSKVPSDVSYQGTSQENEIPITMSETKGQSKWSKWYNNLSKEEKTAYNQRKAKNKSAEVKSVQNKKYHEKHASVIQKRKKESYANPTKKESKKSRHRKRQKEMYATAEGKEQMKAESKKRYGDPIIKESKKSKHRQRQQEMYATLEGREAMKADSRKRYGDPITREAKKARSRLQQKKIYADSKQREKIKSESNNTQKNKRLDRKEKGKDINYVIQQAKLAMQEFPALACTVCHRARFREQVLPCKRSRYGKRLDIQSSMTGDYVHKCDAGCTDSSKYHDLRTKEWVCHTCDRHLKKGAIPPQAIVNGLRMDPIPMELMSLNPLEKHLISIIQPFQKIVPLPKGGQKGVRGQMVCVPADLQKTADTLPWTPDTKSLIRVKLKRKLNYKGHHLHMTVSQEGVMKAIMKLKEINPQYKDIEINEQWTKEMIENGYRQIVDELYTPTLEDQYQVYMESQKDEEIYHNKSDEHTNQVLYEVYLKDKIEEEAAYMEGKYGKYLLNSLTIHREIQEELENYIHMYQSDEHNNQVLYEVYLEDKIEEEAAYMEGKYGKYLLNCLNTDREIQEELEDYCVEGNDNIESAVHPLDRDTEHPFQCSSLQPTDPSLMVSDGDVLSIAPSEGKRPVDALQSEGLCFPTIFPMGNNTYLTKTDSGDYIQKRDKNISRTKYFDSRILSIDNRFQSDSEWIFFAQYLKEVEQIHNAASIALKKGPGFTKQGQRITAGDLVDGSKLKKSVFNTKLGYKSFKDVPGTPPYWENTMNGLFAGFKQIGPPSFFISFSAADRRWPEIAQAMLAQEGKDISTWDSLTWTEYCQLINTHPVTAVLMFERRVSQFVKLMTSQCQPLGGPVKDMFLRREMQDRGWPHIHAMVWVEGAPSPESSDEEHIRFIEKAISCSWPDEKEDPQLHEIVASVQQHSRNHSKTCFKNRTSGCRFNYPLPIASSTYVLRPSTEPPEGLTMKEWQKISAELVEKVKCFLTKTQNLEGLTVQDVLTACGTSEEEYKKSLSAISKRDQIILKRSPAESWVNFYNKDLLRFWSGNMDIQYIFNPYACAKYCLSYIAKAEREMGDLMRKAQHEARAGNMDATSELHHLGDIYLTHRSVSVMEAVYRLTMLPLKTFTRDVIFIPVDDSSYRFSLPLKVLSQKNEDSSQIWTANMVDKYLARPDTQTFDKMTLAEFCADYERCPSPASDKEDGKEKRKSNIHQLKGGLGYIRKRGKRAIIRYYKANMAKEPERYYKNLMRLYFPHRHLETFPPHDTFEALFFHGLSRNSDNVVVKICDIVHENMVIFEKNADLMEDCWEECVRNQGNDEFAWANLAPSAEEERLNQADELEEMEEIHEEYTQEDVRHSFPDETSENNQKAYAIAKTPIVDTTELNYMIRKMNDQQYLFLMHIREWCLQTIRGEKPDPFYIHLTGSAGTGKSHLVRTVYQLASKILQQTSENSGEVVVLTSYTGSAAFNIGGSTIHNLFQIPLNATLPYKGLKNEGLMELGKKLSDIRLLIIDEISFVDKKLLTYIHGRLKQLQHLTRLSHAPFGNISVLSVGDFFQLSPIRSQMLCKKSHDHTDYLWSMFVLYELNEIIRQKGDTKFSEMLNRLRVRVRVRDGKEVKPLLKEDEEFLKSREIEYNPESSEYPQAVYHLFPTWKNVHKHNALMLQRVCTEVHKIIAVDTKHQSGKMYRLQTPRKKETIFQPRELEIGVGARIMLKTNLDVKDGLCNSSIGTVVHIHNGKLPHGQPECIYIKFDDERVGKELRS